MTQPAQPLYTLVTKTPQQVHDDYLRTVKNGLIGLGVANPNVGPGSDYDLAATAISREIAVGQANQIVMADQVMPDTAAGANLDRWLAMVGEQRRGGTTSSGVVTITTSVTAVTIVTGAQLTDPAGLRYQVTIGGAYGNGDNVPVESIDTGKATNHLNGDTLSWVTAPPYTAKNVSVGTTGGSDGLSGGNDSEDGQDEPPRARFFSLMQNPPKAGNSADVALWARQSTPDVQGAFVYPALLGPATAFFAVARAPQTAAPLTSTSKNRDLPSTLVSGSVIPYVRGLVPEGALVVGTSIANQPVDVAILLALPSAPTAAPPGLGGGWLDGSPWPQSISGTTPVTVSSVTDSTHITVNATTPPQVGVSRIATLCPTDWKIYTATVLAVSGTSGAYVLTLDSPWPNVAATHHIWPQCVQQQKYVDALLGAFAIMGPGEWTSNATALQRGFRHPPPGIAWPYALGAQQLRAIEDAGAEVLAAAYLYRSATTPTVPGTITVNSSDPSFPLTSSPPNVLTPRNLSFYQQ